MPYNFAWRTDIYKTFLYIILFIIVKQKQYIKLSPNIHNNTNVIKTKESWRKATKISFCK